MVASSMGSAPAKLPQEKDVIPDSGQGPMSQQHAADSHGHEMHPQKFVRLVGCHESNAARYEGRRASSLRRGVAKGGVGAIAPALPASKRSRRASTPADQRNEFIPLPLSPTG